MITRYFTSTTISFNPFVRGGRTARIFASLLPPDARATGVKVTTTVLPRDSKVGGTVEVVFSECPWVGETRGGGRGGCRSNGGARLEDGKEVKLDTTKMTIADVVEQMDRHSRGLERADELAG